MAKQECDNLRQLLDIFSALSDASRLRAFASLRGREVCVCQLTELLQLAPSTVSKHMSVLKRSGLTESRKQGRWMYYRLAPECMTGDLAAMVGPLFLRLRKDRQFRNDAERLKQILRLDPEVLRKKQCES